MDNLHVEGFWKRQHSEVQDSFNNDHSCKRQKCSLTIKLESESDLSTDEDSESVGSIQNRETASPRDPSDTSSEATQDGVYTVEYDVASSPSEKKWMSDDNSSGSDEFMCTLSILPATLAEREDLGFMADSSDSDSGPEVDSEMPCGDYWTCMRCNCKYNKPYFRFCEKCWQIRKGYFPERPKGRTRRQTQMVNKISKHPETLSKADTWSELKCVENGPHGRPDQETVQCQNLQSNALQESVDCQDLQSNPSQESVDCQDLRSNPSQESVDCQDLQSNPSQESVQSTSTSASFDPCMFCRERPKDGIFVHHAIAHLICCYNCAVKTWNKSGVCPLCRQTPSQIVKLVGI